VIALSVALLQAPQQKADTVAPGAAVESPFVQLHCPVLVLQGDYDLQVTVADAEALHAADPKSALVIFAGDTHMFKVAASKDRMAEVPTYVDPTVPVDPQVVTTIADWIKQLGEARP